MRRSVVRGGYGMYFDQSFLNVPLFAVQQANDEIYATFVNDGSNLALNSPAPDIPRPLVNPLPGTRGHHDRPRLPITIHPAIQPWFCAGGRQELGTGIRLRSYSGIA